ncbi:MAG TPA: glycosyltransferase [Terriglobia bacterium]|nr:glycosyltransferase [Terriglobia bacterium]
MSKPLVSVLIDTYNHERFIEQAIVSVLEQDVPAAEMEVVVVDDGSTDDTPSIVRQFCPRVRYLRKENGGQGSAFNAGIPETHGEIVAFLDGDDWWAAGKLRKVLETFGSDPTVGMVGHGNLRVWPDGRQQTEVLLEGPRFRADSVEGARLFRLRKSFLGTRVSIRADLLKQVLPVPEEIRIEADEFIFTMAAISGDVVILPEPLLNYRIHGGNFFSISSGYNEKSLRLKQQCLHYLAQRLSERLRCRGVDPQVVQILTEVIQVDADQLRLSLDGGYPWETVQAELKVYATLHSEASKLQRAFKYFTLLPALALPPKLYYRLRRRIAQNKLYLRAREKWVPIPTLPHTDNQWRR